MSTLQRKTLPLTPARRSAAAAWMLISDSLAARDEEGCLCRCQESRTPRAQERLKRPRSSRRRSQAPDTNSFFNSGQRGAALVLSLLSRDISRSGIRRERTSGVREAYQELHHRRGSVVGYAAAATHKWLRPAPQAAPGSKYDWLWGLSDLLEALRADGRTCLYNYYTQ